MNTQIAEAVRLLDEHRPGWHDEIDLGRLCMANGTFCILGQLYGHYIAGKQILGFAQNQELITTFSNFDNAWKKLTLERRQQHSDAADAMRYIHQGAKTMPNPSLFERQVNNALNSSQEPAPPECFDKVINRLHRVFTANYGEEITDNDTEETRQRINGFCRRTTRLYKNGNVAVAMITLRDLTNIELREANKFLKYCKEVL